VNFGEPGCLNDINILDKSSIVGALMTLDFSIKSVPYEINGNVGDWMYFLVNATTRKTVCYLSGEGEEGHRVCLWHSSPAISCPAASFEGLVPGGYREGPPHMCNLTQHGG
jgi:hypothetical protein